jgi:hypothetical protein
MEDASEKQELAERLEELRLEESPEDKGSSNNKRNYEEDTNSTDNEAKFPSKQSKES